MGGAAQVYKKNIQAQNRLKPLRIQGLARRSPSERTVGMYIRAPVETVVDLIAVPQRECKPLKTPNETHPFRSGPNLARKLLGQG